MPLYDREEFLRHHGHYVNKYVHLLPDRRIGLITNVWTFGRSPDDRDLANIRWVNFSIVHDFGSGYLFKNWNFEIMEEQFDTPYVFTASYSDWLLKNKKQEVNWERDGF